MSDMREVFPGLFVGDAESGRDEAALRAAKVGGVLKLLRQGGLDLHYANAYRDIAGIEFRHVPLIDAEGNNPAEFIHAVEVFEDLCQRKSRALVHCYAGCIRSPSVAAAFVVRWRFAEVEATLAALTPDQRQAINRASESEESGFSLTYRRDPVFQRLAQTYRAMKARRPIVCLYPPLWTDLFPKVRDFLDSR